MAETEVKKPGLDTPHDVMRRAYGTKLESLRRKELEQLFAIHKIEHGDMIKDDLVRLGQGYEAMGYDLWKRPEEQEPPKFSWPGGQQFQPTRADNIEGSGQGRTTSETLERQSYEPQPEHAPGPVETDMPQEDVADDEWLELKRVPVGKLKALVKAMGLDQSNTDKRINLTTNLMAHADRNAVAAWIAENVPNEDPA